MCVCVYVFVCVCMCVGACLLECEFLWFFKVSHWVDGVWFLYHRCHPIHSTHPRVPGQEAEWQREPDCQNRTLVSAPFTYDTTTVKNCINCVKLSCHLKLLLSAQTYNASKLSHKIQ